VAVDAFKGLVRFEAFELDSRAAELRKGDVKVRLPEQPFRILTMLLEHRAEKQDEPAPEVDPSELPADGPTA
jgi:DNA-binding response OmpR family regulator